MDCENTMNMLEAGQNVNSNLDLDDPMKRYHEQNHYPNI